MCNYGRGHNKEQFCEIVLNLDQWFNRRCRYLELWWPFCSEEPNHLCNFGIGYHEEKFFEIILNLDQWFRRCYLKDFLSRALAAHMFSGAKPFVQFL